MSDRLRSTNREDVMEQNESIAADLPALDRRRNNSYMQVLSDFFLAPSIAFASLREKPRWIVPFILCVMTSVIFLTVTNNYRLEDQKAFLQHNNTLSQEEIKRRIDNIEYQQSTDITQISIPHFLFGTALMTLKHAFSLFGLSLVVWLALHLYSANVTFKVILSVCSFSFLLSLPEAILTIPLVIMKGTMKIYLGAAALLPVEWEYSPLFYVCEKLNVFSIWMVILLIIALPIVAGISKKKAIITIGYLWIIWLLLSMFFGGYTLFGVG